MIYIGPTKGPNANVLQREEEFISHEIGEKWLLTFESFPEVLRFLISWQNHILFLSVLRPGSSCRNFEYANEPSADHVDPPRLAGSPPTWHLRRLKVTFNVVFQQLTG